MRSDWLFPFKDDSKLVRRSTRSFLIVSSSQLIKILLNILGTLLLVRVLEPQAFGLAAMAAVIANFLILFKDLGLSIATVQQSVITQQQISTLFWLNQIGGLFMFSLVILLSPVISWFFDEPDLKWAAILLGSGFILSGLGAQHDALLRRSMLFSRVAIVEVSGVTLGLGVALYLAYTGWDWWSLIWQRVFQFGFMSMASWGLCSWKPSLQFHWKNSRDQILLGLSIGASNLSSYVSRNADNVLIGWWWGAGPLGLYAKPYDLIVLPIAQISWPLGQVVQPTLARIRNNDAVYRSAVAQIFLASSIFPLVLSPAIASDPIGALNLLFGPGWEDARAVIFWISLAMPIQMSGTSLTWALITQKRGGELARSSMVNALANVIAFSVAVPFGPSMMAMAFFFAGVIFRIPYMIWVVGRSGPVDSKRLYKSYTISLIIQVLCTASLSAFVIQGEGVFMPESLVLRFGLLIILSVFLVLASCTCFFETRTLFKSIKRLSVRDKVI